jgi:RNA polymerase sigma factor (sigma-70 family)
MTPNEQVIEEMLRRKEPEKYAKYLLLRYRFWDPELVEDLVAAGLSGLAKAYTGFDPDKGSFIIWAKTKMKGAMLDELGTQLRCRMIQEPTMNLNAITTTTPERAVLASELEDWIRRRILPTLSPERRLCCNLLLDSGFDGRYVADALGVTLAAVSYHGVALKKLIRDLAKKEGLLEG